MESLQGAARSLGQRMEQVEGVQDVSDGLEDAAPALQVVVDRNKAMTKGITVAQIYMQVAAALQDTTTVADVTLDGESMEMIVDAAAGSKLTREKLMDLTISPDSGAMSSSMSGMSGMSGMDSSMSSSMGSMGGMSSMSSGMSSSSASAGLSQLTGGDSQDEDTSFKLGEVAEVKETVSLNSIQRDQQRRCITVSAAVADGYNVTKVTTAVQKALGSVALPEARGWLLPDGRTSGIASCGSGSPAPESAACEFMVVCVMGVCSGLRSLSLSIIRAMPSTQTARRRLNITLFMPKGSCQNKC